MSTHLLARSVRAAFSTALVTALGLAAACTQQGMATRMPTDMAGTTSQGPPPAAGVVPTTMSDQLKAAGLDVKNLPALDEVDDDHIDEVMKVISTTLGAKCTDCHVKDKEAETPNKRIARKMWDEFVVKLTLKDGSPLFCDSCHQGKLEFLDRSDEKAIGGWMKTNFVDGIVRKDGAKHSCTTCHGQPFVGELLDVWALDPNADGGVAESDGGVPPTDGGVVVSTDAGTQTDMATVPSDMAQGTCKVVLNEIQVAGTAGASDEFIELYNPCPSAIALDNYSLVYRSAAGSTDSSLVKLGAQTLAAGAYLVVGGASYSGTATVKYSAGLAATGGGVGLRDGAGVLVDSVGYGTATNAFVHGSAAAAPPSGKSIARTPNGSRTHNNDSLDFVVGNATPGTSN